MGLSSPEEVLQLLVGVYIGNMTDGFSLAHDIPVIGYGGDHTASCHYFLMQVTTHNLNAPMWWIK